MRKLLTSLFALCLASYSSPPLLSQISDDPASLAPASAALSYQSVRPGDSMDMTVTFNTVPSIAIVIQVLFASKDNSFAANVDWPAKVLSKTFKVSINGTQEGGDYKLQPLLVVSLPGPFPKIQVNALSLHVEDLPHNYTLPTAAVANIDLTQKQFIRSQIRPLEDVLV
jgi:hypothetical protein